MSREDRWIVWVFMLLRDNWHITYISFRCTTWFAICIYIVKLSAYFFFFFNVASLEVAYVTSAVSYWPESSCMALPKCQEDENTGLTGIKRKKKKRENPMNLYHSLAWVSCGLFDPLIHVLCTWNKLVQIRTQIRPEQIITKTVEKWCQ